MHCYRAGGSVVPGARRRCRAPKKISASHCMLCIALPDRATAFCFCVSQGGKRANVTPGGPSLASRSRPTLLVGGMAVLSHRIPSVVRTRKRENCCRQLPLTRCLQFGSIPGHFRREVSDAQEKRSGPCGVSELCWSSDVCCRARQGADGTSLPPNPCAIRVLITTTSRAVPRRVLLRRRSTACLHFKPRPRFPVHPHSPAHPRSQARLRSKVRPHSRGRLQPRARRRPKARPWWSTHTFRSEDIAIDKD